MEFRVLGPIEVLVGQEPVPIGGAKERALLARLVLVPNRLVTVSRLIEDLWAAGPPADAPGALQVHVSRVRRALRSVDAHHVLQSRAGGYLVAAPADAVDAARFEALSARARRAADQADFPGAGALWREALALWLGPAFATAAGAPFTAIEGPRLEEARLGAVEGRVAADLAAGDHSALIGELDALTRSYPLREGLWALRMVALYRAGRQAEALRAYQQLRNVLGEMGLEPGAQLRHLETAILRQAPQLLLPGLDPMACDRAPAQPRRSGGASAPSWAAPAGRTAFVGRETERAELERLLDAAVSGTGALVLISGEPGVGKTRLAEELVAEAARGGLSVLAGHCYEMSGAAPYVALVEILESALAAAPSPQAWRQFVGDEAPEIAKLVPRLRRLCPDIPPALEVPAEQERRLLFASVLAVLERAARQVPVVLLFDDLQWADEPTRLWIEQLSERVAALPVLVVATYRDNEVDAGRPLAGTFEALRRRRVARWMPLGLLGREETARLLESLSGEAPPPELVEAVFFATEGNPFFVQEVYRDLADEGRLFDADGRVRADLTVEEIDVPAGVRLVVGRRLSRLGTGTVAVLTAAAVLGRAFSVELLEALDGTERDGLLDAIEDAERARLIVPAPDASGEDRFIFAHELIRQTLLSEVSLTRRRRLHTRVAAALERHFTGNPGPYAAAVAHHLLEGGPAGDAGKAFRFLIEAGRFAMESAAFEEALHHYEEAHALPDAGQPAERAELLAELGAARTSVGRLDAAVDAWRQSVDAFERLGDAEGMGRVCSVACNNLLFLGRWEDDIAIGQQGLAALGERATPSRSRLLGQTAAPLAYVGHYHAASAMVDEALRLADELEDDTLLGEALWAQQIVGMAHMDLRTMLDAGSRAVEFFRSSGHLWHLADVAGYMAYSLTFLGRFEDCRAHTSEFMPLAERLGNRTSFQQQFRMIGLVDVFSSGDIDRLEALGHADRHMCEATGMPWASGWSWLGWARFLRGDWEGALPLLREAARREPPGAINGWNSTLFFDALAYLGEKDEALAYLDTCPLPRPAEPESWTWGAACMVTAAVEGLTVLGRRDRAAELYPSLVDVFTRTSVTSTGYDDGRLYERAAGIAALAAGRWDGAEGHFRTALRQAGELPHRIEEAHTRRWYGQMLLERGAPGDVRLASETLMAAMDDYERMGMPRHRAMTRALLSGG